MKIKIVTDTSCGLSKEECDKLGYSLIPLPFFFDGVEYNDFTLNKEEFYKKLEETKTLSTSQASITLIMNLFDELLKDYDQILYIPIASALSSAYETGCVLENEEKYKGKVFCVKHKTLSTPQRIMLADAQNMIDIGLEASEIKSIIENYISENIWVTTDTLDYFWKGGRLNRTTALFGKLLGIKPILFSDGEKFSVFKKERNINMAMQKMHDLLDAKFEESSKNKNANLTMCIAYCDKNDKTMNFINSIYDLSKKYNCELYVNELPSVLVCHTGPKSIGVAVYFNYYLNHNKDLSNKLRERV